MKPMRTAACVLIASCAFFAAVDKELVEVDDRSAPRHTTLYALDEVLERKVRQCCMKPAFQLVSYCALVVHAAHTVKLCSPSNCVRKMLLHQEHWLVC